jgi:hypothetical protein
LSRSISDKEWKILAIASGGYCAFPGCDQYLVEPGSDQDNTSFLGQAAHIIGDSRQGPRGRSSMSDEDRDKYTNLILLCGVHHKVIDDQPRTYSIPVLQQMKHDHEERMRDRNGRPVVSSSPSFKNETIHSTLLPITHLPEVVFASPCVYADKQTAEIRKRIRFLHTKDELLPFLVREGNLYCFHDLREQDNPFADVTDFGSAEMLRANDLWADPEGHRRYVRLLNSALYKYTGRLGIRYDPRHYRFYFPSKEPGRELSVTYKTLTGRKSTRSVAWEPKSRSTGEGKNFWFHLAAGLRFFKMDQAQWCLSIRPERHLTQDGHTPLPPEQVGRRVTRLKARMYNDLYLAEVNFWREYLSKGQPRIILNFGHQSAIVDAKLLEFDVRWLGIPEDDPPFTSQVGQEDLFSLAELNYALSGERADWDEFSEEELEDEAAG